MAIVFSLNTWFCLLLVLAWYSEAYLCKELTCDWSLPLKGAHWPAREGAGPAGSFSSCPFQSERPSPALLLPIFMDLRQTVTLRGVGDLTI